MADEPELQIAALPGTFRLHKGPPTVKEVDTGAPVKADKLLYSPDGATLVLVQERRASVLSADDFSVQAVASAETNITFIAFSPTGKYLVTLENPVSERGTEHKNLKIWETSEGLTVAAFHRKGITEDLWPFVHFDAHETHLFYAVTNAVVLYDLHGDMAKAAQRVKMDRVIQVALSPAPRKVVATFSPEAGTKPAIAAVVEWGDGGGMVTNRKQFFRAQRAYILWNDAGTHVLFHTLCDFDATNQSYYGESRLYLLSANGKVDMSMSMEGDANVVAAAWSPDSSAFVALGGHVPAVAVMYDQRGQPLSRLGSGPFNEVHWNPFGRFVMLAGFGNLSGDVALYEREGDKQVTALGAVRSEFSVLVQWSPCGRYFLTASVAPRMRVDNRFTVYTYYGKHVRTVEYKERKEGERSESVAVVSSGSKPKDGGGAAGGKEEVKQLPILHACWRPYPRKHFQDRGASPDRVKAVEKSKKKGVDVAAPPKAVKYVPPSLRGGIVGSGDPDDEKPANGNKTASRNAAKRAKKKAAAAVGGEDDAAGSDAVPAFVDCALADACKPADPVRVAPPVEAPADVTPEDAAAAAAAELTKKIRTLRKKYSKVQAAKEKAARGVALQPEQRESIANEAALIAQLRALCVDDV